MTTCFQGPIFVHRQQESALQIATTRLQRPRLLAQGDGRLERFYCTSHPEKLSHLVSVLFNLKVSSQSVEEHFFLCVLFTRTKPKCIATPPQKLFSDLHSTNTLNKKSWPIKQAVKFESRDIEESSCLIERQNPQTSRESVHRFPRVQCTPLKLNLELTALRLRIRIDHPHGLGWHEVWKIAKGMHALQGQRV